MTEPPVPGYCGYIPRIKTTEQGLGARYHMSTKNGLELFAQETASASQRLTGQVPASLDRLVDQRQSVKVRVQVLINNTKFQKVMDQVEIYFCKEAKNFSHLYLFCLFDVPFATDSKEI